MHSMLIDPMVEKSPSQIELLSKLSEKKIQKLERIFPNSHIPEPTSKFLRESNEKNNNQCTPNIFVQT
jgi:hypothetical protein